MHEERTGSVQFMCDSSFLPVVSRRVNVLFTLFALACLQLCIQHILCCVVCFVCLRLVICVPNVASFPGLSILERPCYFTLSIVSMIIGSHRTIKFPDRPVKLIRLHLLRLFILPVAWQMFIRDSPYIYIQRGARYRRRSN